MIKSGSKRTHAGFAFVPDISIKQAPLSDTILASARNVRAVLAGRSLSDSLAETPAALRASAQAVSFHAMRKLGLARGIKRILVQRTPPNPLFDAVLLVSLALLDTALEHAGDAPADSTALRHLPVYAAHTVVDQAVTAVDGQKKMRAYKALLNGSLRRFIRERGAILAQARENNEAVFNHPDWWVAQLRRAYPDQWQALLQAADLPGPMVLRVNTRRVSVDAAQGALDAAGIPAVRAGEAALVLAAA